MRAWPIIGAAVGALAGCAGGVPSGLPQAGGGSVAVNRDGAAFAVELRPGGPGKVLTAAGAVPVAGQTVVVRRDGVGLAMDEGKLAKDVAAEACASAGGRFEGRAVGLYAGAGACA